MELYTSLYTKDVENRIGQQKSKISNQKYTKP